MLRKADALFMISTGLLFVVLITAPYLWANQSAGSDYEFGGFLLNPIDGNSYLAKMYQGWQGNWRFQLPYTSQESEGVYLFLYYLALGQFTRLVDGSLQITFHAARIFGSVLLLFSICFFYRRVLPKRRITWLAFALALFGSGFGWAASFFGLFTSDFWVAEGYPFLSSYANPHFPLGMAILIWIITPGRDEGIRRLQKSKYRSDILVILASLILGIILPFGIILAVVVLGGLVVWDIWERLDPVKGKSWRSEIIVDSLRRSDYFRKIIGILIGGMPILIYEIWITQSDPLLANWNAQNLTISPPVWDLTISLGITLILALPGVWVAWKKKNTAARILIVWSCLGLLMLYAPLGLQRRFMLGLYVPLAGLAGIGLDFLLPMKKGLAFAAICLVVILVIPTNLMILMGGIQAVQNKDARLFLSAEEKEGLDWIAANTPQNALILASPEMGLFVPAYTGRRVIYGHPFETVNAEQMEANVVHYFEGSTDLEALAELSDVDYVFYGLRERQLGNLLIGPELTEVFSVQDLQIFQTGSLPANSTEQSTMPISLGKPIK
jgi:hypothetical protein